MITFSKSPSITFIAKRTDLRRTESTHHRRLLLLLASIHKLDHFHGTRLLLF